MKRKFILQSTEKASENLIFHCSFEKEIVKENAYPMILVSIEPPIIKEIYKTDRDLDLLILSPRLQGSYLYPTISTPCYVYT